MPLSAEKLGNKVATGDGLKITLIRHCITEIKIRRVIIINVLKGEMNFVGLRPEVLKYVVFYPYDVRNIVLSVPLNMTDKASVGFVNENDLLTGSTEPVNDYENKMLSIKLDYYADYVKQHLLILDFTLIIKIIVVIF